MSNINVNPAHLDFGVHSEQCRDWEYTGYCDTYNLETFSRFQELDMYPKFLVKSCTISFIQIAKLH